MIFTNPAGAPELACDECGTEVPTAARAEFETALAAFAALHTSVTRCTDDTPLSTVDPPYKSIKQ